MKGLTVSSESRNKDYDQGFRLKETAFWDEQEELYSRTRSEIYTFHSIILELIEENLFPKDSDNPTFTFKEALWKIAWQLRKLEDLFPCERCGGTIGLEETGTERE